MVEDVTKSIEFYKNILGFELMMTVPEEGQFDFAILQSGNIEIMLQSNKSLIDEIPSLKGRAIGGTFTLYIETEGVTGLYEKIKDMVTVVQDMHDTFYGTKEFAIEDINGYILAFSGKAQHERGKSENNP